MGTVLKGVKAAQKETFSQEVKKEVCILVGEQKQD